MIVPPRRRPLPLTVLSLLVFLAHGTAGWSESVGPTADLATETGVIRLLSTAGPVELPHPFGESLGTNGRMCVHCHSPFDGMSIVPASLRARFDASAGLDPVFRTNDGSHSPAADVSTVEARRAAYGLLLSRGVIRIELAPPPGAEFIVQAVDDPYGFATPTRLSLFRRPLPAVNLAFATSLMWDGRETTGLGLRADLGRQASDATVGHAEAAQPPTTGQQGRIVDLETTLFAALIADARAGSLTADGAGGGPEALAAPGPGTSTRAFTIFDAWASLPPSSDARTQARRAIAAGQDIFNTRNLGVSGLTCGTCHNRPNVGSQSGQVFFNTDVANGTRRPPDLPLYTLLCLPTQTIVRTTDPGRALVTGRCGDIGSFKVPALRGVAARPPFFHDGSAATLRDVVRFYDDLFQARLQPAEMDALIAFLQAL
jgi:hypothetical protein